MVEGVGLMAAIHGRHPFGAPPFGRRPNRLSCRFVEPGGFVHTPGTA